jgi:hypothetical protein
MTPTPAKWANSPLVIRKKNRKGWPDHKAYREW